MLGTILQNEQSPVEVPGMPSRDKLRWSIPAALLNLGMVKIQMEQLKMGFVLSCGAIQNDVLSPQEVCYQCIYVV